VGFCVWVGCCCSRGYWHLEEEMLMESESRDAGPIKQRENEDNPGFASRVGPVTEKSKARTHGKQNRQSEKKDGRKDPGRQSAPSRVFFADANPPHAWTQPFFRWWIINVEKLCSSKK